MNQHPTYNSLKNVRHHKLLGERARALEISLISLCMISHLKNIFEFIFSWLQMKYSLWICHCLRCWLSFIYIIWCTICFPFCKNDRLIYNTEPFLDISHFLWLFFNFKFFYQSQLNWFILFLYRNMINQFDFE